MRSSHLPSCKVAIVFTLFWLLSTSLKEGEISSCIIFPPSTTTSFPRLVMVETLPTLQEFTLCYWFKIHRLDKRLHIFSYAHDAQSNEILTYVDVENVIGFYVSGTPELQVQCPYYLRIGKWHHVCYVWSSWEGQATLVVDSFGCHGNKTGMHKGGTVRSGGALVLGQDQDKVGGGFDPKQNMEGRLSELHLWDSALNSEQILRLSRCTDISERSIYGNLIRWEKTPFQFYDGVVLSPNNICA
ncbi:C-reactive protein 1.1-like [Limulus polyphemus]|uniref:Pentraxin family member n=1 Tax=Limulus polyphemus TaxID=6850 RepID=A0ABM1BF01_LIMPO|nr:C-reactive protein 1.1-like [Limulus polyphemus]